MKTIFQSARGFVTDLGETVDGRTLVQLDTLTAVVLPRYGVWKDTGRKFEVVLVTDDVDEAITRAKL